MTKLMTVISCTESPANNLEFIADGNAIVSIDDFRLIADGLSTTTMTYDNTNELTAASKDNGTISYGYDASVETPA